MRDAQTFQRMETSLLWMWMCLLQMETHPLWVGDVSFTDGNAAARTFGRAHRHRPYHFSYGSCHKIAGEGLSAAQTCVYSRGEVLAAAQNEFIVAANSLPLH